MSSPCIIEQHFPKRSLELPIGFTSEDECEAGRAAFTALPHPLFRQRCLHVGTLLRKVGSAAKRNFENHRPRAAVGELGSPQ